MGNPSTAPANEPCDCDESLVPGTMATAEFGIQRCDACERFDGDLSAAAAVADRVGGEVCWWAVPDDVDPNPDVDPVLRHGVESTGYLIADDTNPWVTIAGIRADYETILRSGSTDLAFIATLNTLAADWSGDGDVIDATRLVFDDASKP